MSSLTCSHVLTLLLLLPPTQAVRVLATWADAFTAEAEEKILRPAGWVAPKEEGYEDIPDHEEGEVHAFDQAKDV